MQDSLELAHECVQLYHTYLFMVLVTVLVVGIAAVTIVKMLIDRNRPDCPCKETEDCDEDYEFEDCEFEDCCCDCGDDCNDEIVAAGEEEDEHWNE